MNETCRHGNSLPHRSARREASILVGLVVAILSGGFAPPLSASATESSTAQGADPVLRDVVRLLEAKLSEPLILRWLAESGKRPGQPTAEDLVALKKAGASDELVAALLDRAHLEVPPASAEAKPVTVPPASAAMPAASSPSSPAPTTAPPPPVTAATPPPAAAPPVSSAATASSAAAASVKTELAVRYIHQPAEDEGEAWDLVVYLDGSPTAPIQAANLERNAVTWSESRALAPGPHVLRWAQEWHRERKSEDGQHAARFDKDLLRFTLRPGAPAAINFEFRDRMGIILRPDGPVDVVVTQGEVEVASEHTNNDPAKWPLLCEDVEANFAGRKSGFSDRQALRSCVRWAEVWQDVPAPPDRHDVRPPLR